MITPTVAPTTTPVQFVVMPDALTHWATTIHNRYPHITLSRLEKATRIIAEGRVTLLCHVYGATEYAVIGDTGQTYTVSLNAAHHHVNCNCQDWTFQSRQQGWKQHPLVWCKHALAAAHAHRYFSHLFRESNPYGGWMIDDGWTVDDTTDHHYW